MQNLRTLFLIIVCITLVTGCRESEVAVSEKETLVLPWWASVEPIVIGDKAFYGEACSVTQVISNDLGIKSASVIFSVPAKLFTYCSNNKPNHNYLEFDGEYIILNVDRQTVGAGSWTGERYRSADFTTWEEYIGVTWVERVEYEAWRKVGSISSKADSIKKVIRE